MAIDPRQLRTYLAVCRAKSISEAARRMNISQPSVSVAIRELEREVGATLFERARSGLRLTAAGAALLRRAEALEVLLQNAAEEISLLQADIHGPLVVGGTPGALASLLPRALAGLQKASVKLQMRVLERTDRELIEMLRSEQVDLACVTTGLEAPPDDFLDEPILSDPFALIVSPQHDHLPRHLGLAVVADLPWVLPEAQGGFRRQVDALFIAADVATPKNVIRCDSLMTTKSIVSHTDRVTILPKQVVAAELSAGVLRAITLQDIHFVRSVGIRRLSGRPLSPAAAAFMDALRALEAPPPAPVIP